MQDLHFVITQSPESTKLLEVMVTKKLLPRVTVRMKNSSNHSFELVVRNVRSRRFGRGWGSEAPMEQISMSFQTGKFTVKHTSGSHSVEIKN